MKSAIAFSLVAVALAAPAPQASDIKEATTCPDLNGAQVVSNNNQGYKLSCAKWIDSDDVIRITDTEVGYQGCLTACDGTIGCGVVQYIATDDAQTKGSCTIFPKSELKDGSSNSWTVAVPLNPPSDDPTTTTCSAPTGTASSTAAPTPTQFNGLAIRSGSDIQYAAVSANGQSFWLGRPTTTYCPSSVPCAADNSTDPTTSFASAGTGTLSLDVQVPGGQQVYVVSGTGLLKFTQAHSAAMADGAVATGFAIDGTHLTFEGQDWLACPAADGDDDGYAVYAASRYADDNDGSECLGFAFRPVDSSAAAPAWQYV